MKYPKEMEVSNYEIGTQSSFPAGGLNRSLELHCLVIGAGYQQLAIRRAHEVRFLGRSTSKLYYAGKDG
jgi:hypothetical protein